MRNFLILVAAASLLLSCSAAGREIIFQDDFSSGNLNNWTILNGSWSVVNGEMCGTSDGALIIPNTGTLTSYEFSCAARFQAGLAWGIDFRYIDPYNRLRLDFAPGAPNQLNVNIYQNGVLAAHPYAGTCTQYGSYTTQHYCKFVVNGADFQVYFGNSPNSLDLLCDTTFTPFTSGTVRYQVWGYPPDVWSCFDNVLIESQEEWQLIYEEDFYADPGWVTNNPGRFHWNPTDQNYYAELVNWAQEYGVYPLSQVVDSSFKIEYDAKLIQVEWGAGFNFGIYSDTIGYLQPSTLNLEFDNPDPGPQFDAWWYTPQGGGTFGSSNDWQLNVWYHIVIIYEADTHIASFQVTLNGTPVAGSSTQIIGQYEGLRNLGLSRRWSWPPQGQIAQGYVDNVKLYVPPTGPGGQIPPILWTHAYGENLDDWIYCVQQTQPDGGFIAVGAKTVSGHGTQLWVVKTYPCGTLQWEHTWGGTYNDLALWVEQTEDGGYIIVGSWKYTNTDYDAYLIKLDANGNTQWEHNYGGAGDGDDGTCVQQTSDGGYIFAGGTYAYGDIWDFWLVKVDAMGTLQWHRPYPMGGYQAASFVRQTSDGGYIMSGYTTPYYPMPWDAYIIKTNPSGDIQWTHQFGGSGGDYASCVRQLSSGDYVVTGFTDSYGAGGTDGLIYKLNNTGTLLWHRTYGGTGDDEFRKFQITADGGFAIVGTDASSSASSEFWLVKTNSQGDLTWDATYGGADDDLGWCMDLIDDGGYILGGPTQSYGAGGWDGWLVRLGPEGPPPPPPPLLEISLAPVNPPIIIPQNGGSFSFHATVSNASNMTQTFDAWCNIQVPGGSQFTVLGPVNLTLGAGVSLTRLRTQAVPANAPGGEYAYWGFVGDYPWTVTDSDQFPFVKQGSDAGLISEDGWICSGELFPGEIAADGQQPKEFALHGAFPNPFNPTTAIRYQLPADSHVDLRVYDISGRLVATLVDGWREAGVHEAILDAQDLPSGIYLARLIAGDFAAVQKMVLMK